MYLNAISYNGAWGGWMRKPMYISKWQGIKLTFYASWDVQNIYNKNKNKNKNFFYFYSYSYDTYRSNWALNQSYNLSKAKFAPC